MKSKSAQSSLQTEIVLHQRSDKFFERLIPVHESLRSNKVIFYVRQADFSQLFQEMLQDDLFEKVFLDDEKITAKSIHDSFFVADIKGVKIDGARVIKA